MTIKDLLHQAVKKHEDRTAFNYYTDGSWQKLTYKEFYYIVQRLASLLRQLETGRDDKVGICMENSPYWCAAYLSASVRGAICIPIDSELGTDEIKNILESSNTKLVFTDKATEPEVSTYAKTINLPIEIKKEETFIYDTHDISEHNIASIIYTSGTTGTPKGVMLTHRNFCQDALAVTESGLIQGNDNVLSVLPLHHTYPFMCNLLVPIHVGATITYPRNLKGLELINTIKTQQVTALIGVPRLLEMFLSSIDKKLESLSTPAKALIDGVTSVSGKIKRTMGGFDLGHMLFRNSIHDAFGQQFRFMASGGARLSPEVMMKLEGLGFTVVEGYGLTETSPVITFNPLDKRKPGSCGKPLKGVDIKIDKNGEILVRGPMVMNGYVNMPDETKKVLKNGWFYTGDQGRIDKDGYLYITGRIKEVIVLSSGKNVYPEDLEKKYSAIPLIEEICIYGNDKKDRVVLNALIVPNFEYAKQMQIANIYESLKWDIYKVSQTLPSFMRIQGFTLSKDPLPKTRLGKVKRFLVKDVSDKLKTKAPYETTEEDFNDGDETLVKVKELIKQLIETGGADVRISSSDNIEIDLGFDSLKRLELLSAIENKFSINLPEGFGLDTQTVGDLAKALDGALIYDSGINEQDKKDSGPPSLEKIEQDAWGKTPVRSLLSPFMTGLFKHAFKGKVYGLNLLPEHPFILCPNHSSYIDGFAIWASLPKHVRDELYFQGAREFFKSASIFEWFGRVGNILLIDPDSYLKGAMANSSKLLEMGKSLCIFPEGGRSLDGKVHPFKPGVGMLSANNNVPLVPVFIKGSYEAMPRGQKLPSLTNLTVKIGPPCYPPSLETKAQPRVDLPKYMAGKVYEEVLKLEAQG